MLYRNIDVENVPFVDLSSNHWLVNRNRDLFPGTSLSNIFPLVLDPDNLSDALSPAVDERILRLDDPIKHFDTDYCWITPAKDESLQQLDLAWSNQKVHLGLRARESLSLHPSRILLQYMVEDISLKTGIFDSAISSSASGSSFTPKARTTPRCWSLTRTAFASTTSLLETSPTSASRTGIFDASNDVVNASSEPRASDLTTTPLRSFLTRTSSTSLRILSLIAFLRDASFTP